MVVGSVVLDRVCQPATLGGCDVLIYDHLCWCVMCQSYHMTEQVPSSFDGRQGHWAAFSSCKESIAEHVVMVSDANGLPQLTSVKCVKPNLLCWC